MDDKLNALLNALTDLNDASVCLALADRLEEIGHERASLVRELAAATPVIPADVPGWHRPRSGGFRRPGAILERCARDADNAMPDHYPIACGAWWAIELWPEGVSPRVYGDVLHSESTASMGAMLTLETTAELTIRLAFELCRRQLIVSLMGDWSLWCCNLFSPLILTRFDEDGFETEAM
jgi:hypothetical protein